MAESLKLVIIREQFGRPSEDETKIVLRTVFSPMREKALDIGNMQAQFIPYLQELKASLAKSNKGTSPSRPALTTEVLEETVGKQYSRASQHALITNDPEGFRFYFDIHYGISRITAGLLTAELYLKGDIDEAIDSFAEKKQRLTGEQTTSERAADYVKIKGLINADLSLLKRDPTGFLLVDSLADNSLDNNLSIPPALSKVYVAEGLKLTRDMYKLIYPMSASLYKE